MIHENANPCLVASHELRLVESGLQSVDSSLDRIVTSIANQMQTDVGSLYMFEPEDETLVLVATVGLLQSCVGNLRMRLDEGLVGLAAQTEKPVVLACAPEHPRFKYFPEADEDEYQSFLGVPVMHREKVCGVLVVQTIEARDYSRDEIAQLSKIAEMISRRLYSHSVK